MADLSARTGFQRERLPESDRPQNTSPSEESIAGLLGGLVADAQTLVRREVDLAKQEVLVEVDKVKQGAMALGIGVGITAVGGILLTLMLVHFLIDVVNLAPWISYLIVGALFAVVGGVLLMRGINRLKQIDPLPREAIAEVKENVEWIKEQNPSDKI